MALPQVVDESRGIYFSERIIIQMHYGCIRLSQIL